MISTKKNARRPPCPKCKGRLYRDKDLRIREDRIVCLHCGWSTPWKDKSQRGAA